MYSVGRGRLTMQHPNDRIQFTQTLLRTCVINQSWHIGHTRRKPLNHNFELGVAGLLTAAAPRSGRDRSEIRVQMETLLVELEVGDGKKINYPVSRSKASGCEWWKKV